MKRTLLWRKGKPHSQKPPNTLHGGIVITWIKGVAKRVVYGVVYEAVEGVERAQNRVLRNEMEEVFDAAEKLEAGSEFSGNLEIEDRKPGAVRWPEVIGYNRKALGAVPVTIQVEGNLGGWLGIA